MVAHQDCRLLWELTFPLNADAHDALHLLDKSHKPTVDVAALVLDVCSNHAHPQKGQQQPGNGGQRQQQKQHDSNKSSDGAHGDDLGPKVRLAAVQEASNNSSQGEGALAAKVPGRTRFIFLAGVACTFIHVPVTGWIHAKKVQVK